MEHLARRKQLKKEAAARLGVPLDTIGWMDGVLIHLATNMSVDGVPTVRKPVKPSEPVSSGSSSGYFSRW